MSSPSPSPLLVSRNLAPSPNLLNVPNSDRNAQAPSPSPSSNDESKYRVKKGALDDTPSGSSSGSKSGKSGKSGSHSPAADAGAGAQPDAAVEPQEDLLSSWERRSGVPKLYIAIGGVILAWIIIVGIFGPQTFVHFVAFAYPAYMSYKTLEYSGRGPADDVSPLVHWLTYWVVYALFIAFELIVDPLLATNAWYTVSKLAFLFWCFLPQTQGCIWVYRLVVRPALHANEERIDKTIDRLHFAAVQAGAEIRDVSSEVFTTAISNFGASLFVSSLNAAAKANSGERKGDERDRARSASPRPPVVDPHAAADDSDGTPLNSPHRKDD